MVSSEEKGNVSSPGRPGRIVAVFMILNKRDPETRLTTESKIERQRHYLVAPCNYRHMQKNRRAAIRDGFCECASATNHKPERSD
jgi:hypothetical protein